MPIIVIIGFLIGSLWVVWPFQARHYELIQGKLKLLASSPVWPEAVDGQVLGSLALMVSGFLAVIVINRLAHKREQTVSGTKSVHDGVS